mgnify:FL=1
MVHRGIHCTCSSRSNGGGVAEDKMLSSEKKSRVTNKNVPECFGIAGSGDCEHCDLTNECALTYAIKHSAQTYTA